MILLGPTLWLQTWDACETGTSCEAAANVNAVMAQGKTPLHVAIQQCLGQAEHRLGGWSNPSISVAVGLKHEAFQLQGHFGAHVLNRSHIVSAYVQIIKTAWRVQSFSDD